MTKYRVLRRKPAPADRVAEVGDEFVVLATAVEAHGPQTAIRKVAADIHEDDVEGTYVAVPEANWTVEPVSIERPKPRLRVGQADGQTQLETEPPAPPAEEES